MDCSPLQHPLHHPDPATTTTTEATIRCEPSATEVVAAKSRLKTKKTKKR